MNIKENCFNFIRLYACINVLLYHIGWFMDVKLPLLDSLVNPINGVPVFFLISGFLIWFSIEKTKNFSSFVKKRILRLYPELWISILIEIFCLLLLYRGASIQDYIQMFVLQSTIFPNHTPAVFDSYGMGSLNVSLWTVPIIIQFYIFIWFLHKWLVRKSAVEWICILFISIFSAALIDMNFFDFLPNCVNKVIGLSVFAFLWIFLLGSFAARYFNYIIPFLSKIWYVSLLLLIINEIYPSPFSIVPYSLSGVLLLACSILGIAYKFKQIRIKKDISYPVYLYHMLFVNAAIHIGYRGNWLAALMVIILTFILTYLSTLFVEKYINQIKLKLF